jgi:hypothetical protein
MRATGSKQRLERDEYIDDATDRDGVQHTTACAKTRQEKKDTTQRQREESTKTRKQEKSERQRRHRRRFDRFQRRAGGRG